MKKPIEKDLYERWGDIYSYLRNSPDWTKYEATAVELDKLLHPMFRTKIDWSSIPD